jgi:hypothetical protein
VDQAIAEADQAVFDEAIAADQAVFDAAVEADQANVDQATVDADQATVDADQALFFDEANADEALYYDEANADQAVLYDQAVAAQDNSASAPQQAQPLPAWFYVLTVLGSLLVVAGIVAVVVLSQRPRQELI